MRFLPSQRTRKPRPHHYYRSPGHGRSASRRPLRLELLEERTVLSGGIVTTSVFGRDLAYDSFLQPDGEIVVAGRAQASYGDDPDFAVLRYQADGTLDPTFGDGGIATTNVSHWGDVAHAAVPYPDGKILLAGSADSKEGYYIRRDFALARYNSDGSLDKEFGFKGKVKTDLGTGGIIYDVMLQPDEKIVAAGGGTGQFRLARYTATGELDPSFGNGGIVETAVGENYDVANAVTMHQGKILAVGETNNYDFALARYNLDGSLDTTFGGDGIVTTSFGTEHFSEAQAVAVDAQGNVVAVGVALVPAPTGGWVADLAVARYLSDGTLDTSFGGGDGFLWTDFGGNGYDNGYGVAIQDDGNIVVVGFTDFPERQFTVGRYLPDGTLDPSFGPDGNGKVLTPILNSAEARSVDIQSDGKIVVSGFADGDSGLVIALARYNPDGSLDETFGVPGPAEPGITVSPTAGLETTEKGGAAEFSVVLDTEPSADVVIGIATSDATEGTVDQSNLTFTQANWNLPQLVTVMGVDDSIRDGDVAYTVMVGPVSGASEYGVLDPDDVSVVNKDNEKGKPPKGSSAELSAADLFFFHLGDSSKKDRDKTVQEDIAVYLLYGL